MKKSVKKHIDEFIKPGEIKTDGKYFYKLYEIFRSNLISIEFKTLSIQSESQIY